ncbi:hypothetical protein [Halobacteriovorax sp. CON-3]|uniref:hypothetical protein n=1 Tax=Halobacteriovorax sp. CON-3 TaxID=3157710 RepID=UPI00371C720C
MKILLLFLTLSLLFSCSSVVSNVQYPFKEKNTFSDVSGRSISVAINTNDPRFFPSEALSSILIKNNVRVESKETLRDTVQDKIRGVAFRRSGRADYELVGKVVVDMASSSCGRNYCLYRNSYISIKITEIPSGDVLYSDSYTYSNDVEGMTLDYYSSYSESLRNNFRKEVVNEIASRLFGRLYMIEVPFITDPQFPKLEEIKVLSSSSSTWEKAYILIRKELLFADNNYREALELNRVALLFMQEKNKEAISGLKNISPVRYISVYEKLNGILANNRR